MATSLRRPLAFKSRRSGPVMCILVRQKAGLRSEHGRGN